MDGLPLLSGRPPDIPDVSEDNCRRCNKDFHFFTRTKRCNHCGYLYCSSCTDFQALLPRSGPNVGYELVPVCAYCMDMLSITSSSKNKLRTLPISKLRAYMKAYNIRAPGTAVEKDDLVEAILRSKNSDGCLFPVHENYYRSNSVPRGLSDRYRTRTFFSRRDPNVPSQSQSQPQPHPRPQPSYTPRQPNSNYQARQSFSSTSSSSTTQNRNSTPGPAPNQFPVNSTFSNRTHNHNHEPNHSTNFNYQHDRSPYGPERHVHTSASQTNFHSRPPPQMFFSSRPRSATSTGPPSTPAPAPAPIPRPPLPVPTLNELLEKEESEIGHLPISTLKAVLFDNRVNMPAGVLEKEDLVRKVIALVTDERRDREARLQEEELEEILRMDQVHIEETEEDHSHASTAKGETSHADEKSAQGSSSDNVNSSKQPKSHMMDIPSSHEGLCVVCQDEHANMAIIDCGHLALCKSCSELVMKTSRECPLCRTRIVTEQRLLRIFRS